MAKCLLCNSNKKDDIKYGEFIEKEGVSVHTYCLYLSSGLVQNGDEDNSFFGFLPKDIKKESERVRLLRCHYCHKPYANIGCCETKCRRSFHFICGIENGAENQFVDTFRSYCHSHLRKEYKKPPSKSEICCICYERISEKVRRTRFVGIIKAPCCRNGWFHKWCLQHFARSAGYFFKCPLCNDQNKFRKNLPYHGIFIPDRDAVWELEPNAFSELLERPTTCCAEICNNTSGRKTTTDTRDPLLYCNTCGSVAIHKNCLATRANEYTCTECQKMVSGSSNIERDSGRGSFDSAHEEDEVLDVCNIDDSDDSNIDSPLQNLTVRQKRNNIIHDDSDEEYVPISYTSDADSSLRIPRVRQKKNKILSDDSNEEDVDSKPLSDTSDTNSPFRNFGQRQKRNQIISDKEDVSIPDTSDIDSPFWRKAVRKKRYQIFSDNSHEDNISEIEHKSSDKDDDLIRSQINRKQSRFNVLNYDNENAQMSPQHSVKDEHSKYCFQYENSDIENATSDKLNIKPVNNDNSSDESDVNFRQYLNKAYERLMLKRKISDSKSSTNNSTKNIENSDNEDQVDVLEIFTKKAKLTKRKDTEKVSYENYVNKTPDDTNSCESLKLVLSESDSSCSNPITAQCSTSSLKISCIANRTRKRKSNFYPNSSKKNQNQKKIEKENVMEMSCIANRTRRKSICYENKRLNTIAEESGPSTSNFENTPENIKNLQEFGYRNGISSNLSSKGIDTPFTSQFKFDKKRRHIRRLVSTSTEEDSDDNDAMKNR